MPSLMTKAGRFNLQNLQKMEKPDLHALSSAHKMECI